MAHKEEVKEAVWQEKKRGISVVWIVPVVALLIGAWLMYDSISHTGPKIHISFKSASGIMADKTVIKYKGIVVGKVTAVVFGSDLHTVDVTAQIDKSMESFLSEHTRFWIVQAKLGVGEVHGLDTLLAGVYIEMDPKRGERSVRRFQGLDEIPVISSGEKGKTYKLIADDIGSLSVGSPIYYKKLKAGSVAGYKLDPDGKHIMIDIFIKEPFYKLINDKTRFYNASGISMSMNADGVNLQTESLVSVLVGGLAFDNFLAHGKGKSVEEGYAFNLYQNQNEAKKLTYKRVIYFWTYFDDSIRGLSIGAPVEFRGVKVGEVVSFSLIGNAETAEFKIPILIKIEPERFTVLGDQNKPTDGVNLPVFEKLIKKGFRAQLQSGNLITGELFIDLNIFKNVPPVEIRKENGFYVIPSVPATLSAFKYSAQEIITKIAKIPFEEIGKETQVLVHGLQSGTLPKVDRSIESLDTLIKDTNALMKDVRKNYVDSNAQINKKLLKLIDEMTRTSKSVKQLTDYLERHPESLIRGK